MEVIRIFIEVTSSCLHHIDINQDKWIENIIGVKLNIILTLKDTKKWAINSLDKISTEINTKDKNYIDSY
jgi:hypothetical protein